MKNTVDKWELKLVQMQSVSQSFATEVKYT